MMLACSSPMVPGATLTEKAELLKQYGYDALAVFQPYDEWDDGVRRELATLESRTGIRPVGSAIPAGPLLGSITRRSA